MRLLIDGRPVSLTFLTTPPERVVQLVPIPLDRSVLLEHEGDPEGVPWVEAAETAKLTVDLRALGSTPLVFEGGAFLRMIAAAVRSDPVGRVELDLDEARGWGLEQPGIEPAQPTPSPQSAKLTEASLTEMVKLDYADRWAEAERYRARAQTAFTISTTVAASLGVTGILAGLFGDVSTVPDLVLWLGGANFVLWAVAAMLALYATSYAVHDKPRDVSAGEQLTPSRYAQEATARLKDLKTTLRQWTQRAVIAIALALAVTVGFLLASLALPQETDWNQARLTVTTEGEEALEQLCQLEFSPVNVEVAEGTTDDEVIRARFPPNTCQERQIETQIPRGDVVGIVWVD